MAVGTRDQSPQAAVAQDFTEAAVAEIDRLAVVIDAQVCHAVYVV
ncbi:MAG: hypothetical protein ACREP0_11935 [Rhodanobacteraceae bacterium]